MTTQIAPLAVDNEVARRRTTMVRVYPTGPRLPAVAVNALQDRPVRARIAMLVAGLLGLVGLMFVTT